ncbi:MAG: hypothetical protein NC910_00505 [Candidatus Omnitrophica bacterium]|nr:hypothetical protein [Candidatus Omnitrophota bacterium]
MEHRSLTIVFIDMKGFTSRTSRQTRTEMMDLVQTLRDLLREPLARHRGALVKAMGDGFLLTFESPTDAVLACVSLQRMLRERNAGSAAGQRIEVRAAVNTGEVAVERGDVYGQAVNVAARLLEMTKPNEIYLTEATYLSMNRSEVWTDKLGSRTFRGMEEPVRIYRVVSFRKWRLPGWARFLLIFALAAAAFLLMLDRAVSPPGKMPFPGIPEPVVVTEQGTVADQSLDEAAVSEQTEPAPVEETQEAIPAAQEELVPEPEGPDPNMLAAIAQQLQGYGDWIAALRQQAEGVEMPLRDLRNGLSRMRLDLSQLEGRLDDLIRRMPQVRQDYLERFRGLIDKYQQAGDSYSAGYLTADLARHEAKAGEWEVQLQQHGAAVRGLQQFVRTAERLVSDSLQQLQLIQQETTGQAVALEGMRELAVWDPSIDRVGTALTDLANRMNGLTETLASLQAEVEARRGEIAAVEEGVAGWDSFRAEWQNYLSGWQ